MLLAAIGLMALGGGLIWVALWLFGDFEPHCVSNSQWECFDTVEEQRTAYNRDTFVFVFLPGALMVVGGLRLVYLVLDRLWPGRWLHEQAKQLLCDGPGIDLV